MSSSKSFHLNKQYNDVTPRCFINDSIPMMLHMMQNDSVPVTRSHIAAEGTNNVEDGGDKCCKYDIKEDNEGDDSEVGSHAEDASQFSGDLSSIKNISWSYSEEGRI